MVAWLVISVAPHSSAAALGLGFFFVAASKLHHLGRGDPREEDALESTSTLQLFPMFFMVFCGRLFLGCIGLVRQHDPQLELFCLASSHSSS